MSVNFEAMSMKNDNDKYYVYMKMYKRLYRTQAEYDAEEILNIKTTIEDLAKKQFATRLDIAIHSFIKIVYLNDLAY